MCGRSRLAQRAFFEFALVQTEGEVCTRREWRQITEQFAVFLSTIEGAPRIALSNCTILTKPGFSDAVERYFAYLDKPGVSTFYAITDRSDHWLSTIVIEESYIVPAMLLSGLLSKYEESWERFLRKYQTAAKKIISKDQFVPQEFFSMFSWLLWGPSREVAWRSSWDGMCQIAYGDENNSLPLFVVNDTDTMEKLRNVFYENDRKGIVGGLCTSMVRLEPKKQFFKDSWSSFKVENSYFINHLSLNGPSAFVTRLHNFSSYNDLAAQTYYCTAYVWILFELVDNDPDFNPEHGVVFFEHANIADSGICSFFTDRLVEKALEHFKTIFSNPALFNRKYRFVCGLNEAVEEKCRKRFSEEMAKQGAFPSWLSDSVLLSGKIDIGQVFTAIDDYFSEDMLDIAFSDLSPQSRGDMADLAVFYSGIYSDAFPNDNERETLPNILSYLKKSKDSNEWNFHVILAKNHTGEIVGGGIFDYFSGPNALVTEFIVADPEMRGVGLGKRIWNEILRVADCDAREAKHSRATYAFCEVESPDLCKNREMRHLDFWRRQMFKRVLFDYVQPSLDESLLPVHGLWLLALLRNPGDDSLSIPGRLVAEVIWNYIHFAMAVEDPQANAEFVAMQKQLLLANNCDLVTF